MLKLLSEKVDLAAILKVQATLMAKSYQLLPRDS
jgi:hypothetical protein